MRHIRVRTLPTTALLACGVAAVGLTGAPSSHAAATCNGLAVTISGTDGNDHRDGTAGKDVFSMKGATTSSHGWAGMTRPAWAPATTRSLAVAATTSSSLRASPTGVTT